MNRFLQLAFLLVFAGVAQAQNFQSIMPENSDKPVKLDDVIKAYEQEKEKTKSYYDSYNIEEGKEEGEGLDYHFDRWVWYMSSHLDNDGYIVSPAKNYDEWLKIKNRGQNKGTATAVNSSNWTFQGPTTSAGGYAGIGRINGVGFHPTDPNIIWVASAGGGAWKTTNNGVSWTAMTQSLPVLGTSDVDINPLNPNIIYLCTGDRDASDTYSIGVMKSTNAGGTWDTTGLKWNKTQSRLTNNLVLNKINPNTVIVATSNGIYKSTDAGTTFSQKQTGHFKDIVYHPTDTNILYAATNNASGSAQIWRSSNGGNNWTQVTNFSGKGRIALAVSAADVRIVKAIVTKSSNNGLDSIYTSTDTGKTYTRTYGPTGCNGDLISGDNKTSPTTCGKQGWYDLCIALNPNNANEVVVGGVNTWRSTNGGSSWSFVTQWWSQLAGIATVHADKHFMAFHPLVANRLIQGCDGGIYRTDNVASTLWTDMTNGLGITQFYRNAVSHTSSLVLAGAQDNGTKGLRSTGWVDENGGDGMDCQVDFADSNTYYTSTQYGNIDRQSTTWGDDDISNNIVGKPTNGAWITPFIINPHNPAHIITGYREVYASADRGASWTSISGADINGTRNVHRLAMTPADNKTLYAITAFSSGDTAKVFYTFSYTPTAAVTFNTIVTPYKVAPTDIKIDHKKKDKFWLTFGGYGSPQIVEYNAGTWTSLKTGLPDVPVHCIDVDTATGFMYLGTDIGVYYLDTATKQWEPFNNASAMPVIEVADLGINYKKRELWAATYGRGLWKSVLQKYQSPVDTTDTTDTTTMVKMIPLANNLRNIFPNPNNGIFTVSTDASLFADKPLLVTLTDMQGRIVWKNSVTVTGSGAMYIKTSGLAKGVYSLDAYDKNYPIGRMQVVIE